MVKRFVRDTFEELEKLGRSTTSGSAKKIAKIFDPKELINKALGRNSAEKSSPPQVEKDKPKHTPLDFDKLQSAYQNQDEVKLKKLRFHLFQNVKQGEQRAIDARKQEDTQKKQTEERAKQVKEQEKAKAQARPEATPAGKQRRSIFSHKKKAVQQHAETKPNVGKD